MSTTDDEEAARFVRAVRLLTPEQQWKVATYLERLKDVDVTEQEFRDAICRILTEHGLQ